MRKRAKHIIKCKRVIWKRWTEEYLRVLRERYNLKYVGKERVPKMGDVLLIKDNASSRNKWSFGVVKEMYQARNGVVIGANYNSKHERHISIAPCNISILLNYEVSTTVRHKRSEKKRNMI